MHSNQFLTYRGPFSAEALSRLSLREHPFLPSADPRFLYLSKQHLAVLDRVQDVINWREGLAVVEGVIGVGKGLKGAFDALKSNTTPTPQKTEEDYDY